MPENIVIPLGFDASSLSPTVIRAVNEAQSRIREIKLKVDARPLGTISRDLTQFDRSLEASNARVLAFGASVGIISAVAGAFKSLVSSTIEVEKRLTDIQVVLQASQQNFVQFTERLFDVAKATGQSFETVATAATEFSRQGLGIPEILKRTNDALILSRLSGLSAAEAVQDLTAAINTFKSAAVDSTAVINKLATVDAAFAVSSADLAEAIKRTGSAAEDAKVSLDELVAIVTSAQQTTARGGAVIGNAFKTIFTRLGDATTLDALEELNIKVRDIRGNSLPAIQVLQNLANRFDTLSDAQQNATAKLVGGLFQINVLRASLGDLSSGLSVYERALNTSTGAVDEAIKRNEALNTTFASLLNKTQVNLKQFFATVGKQTFEPIGKNAFNLFNALFDSSKGTNNTQEKSFGQKVGQGLINGVSDFLKGPAIVIVGALLYKLFSNAFASAQGAFKSVVGFNSATERQKNIQEGINRVLASGNTHYQQRLAAARSVAEQEQIVLDILRQENALLSQRKGVNAAVAANLVGRVNFPNEGTSAVIKKPGFASGYVPSVAQEVKAVREGVGGASPSSKPVEIKGFNFGGGKKGDVVVNTSEYLVDNFKGGDGTAVFNPDMIKKVGGIANLNKLGKVRKVTAATGYVPNYAKIPLVGKFYDTLKVGYGLQPSPDGGVEQRRLLGGIGFSSTPEAKEAGAASAIRGIPTNSFINNSLRDYKEAAFVPFISHKNVAYPIGGGLLTNEALFSHALATMPNREKMIKKMMTSGDDVFKVLREHSGADMMKLVEQYFLKTKTGRAHLMKAAREIEEPRLAPFFMPDGKVSNIQKGAFAFNSARLIKRDGVFSHRNEGTHLSYPFLINGRTQAENIAPVEFNELFDKSNTTQNALAAAQRFAIRMLDTNVKGDRKILEKIGFAEGFIPGWKHVPNYANFRGLSEKEVTSNLSRDAIEGDFFKNFYRQYREIHPLEGAERARFSAIYAGQSGGVSDSHVFKTSVGIYDRFRNLTGDAKHDPYQYFDFLRSFGQGTNPFIQEGRKRTVFPLPKDIPPSEIPKFVQQLAAQSNVPLRDAFRVVNLGNALRGIPPTSKKFGPYYHALEGNPVPPVDRHVIGSALGAKQALEEDDLKITKSEIAFIQSAMDRAVGSKKLSNLGFEDKAQLQAAIYGARSLQAGRNVPDINFFKNQLGRLSAANGFVPNYARTSLLKRTNFGKYKPTPENIQTINEVEDFLRNKVGMTGRQLPKIDFISNKKAREKFYMAAYLPGKNVIEVGTSSLRKSLRKNERQVSGRTENEKLSDYVNRIFYHEGFHAAYAHDKKAAMNAIPKDKRIRTREEAFKFIQEETKLSESHARKVYDRYPTEEAAAITFEKHRGKFASGFVPNYARFDKGVARKIADLHNEFGGVSYNLRAGNLAGREAYALSLFPELSKIIPKQIITPDEIEEFYGRNKKLLNHPLSVLGGWYDGMSRSSYLDVSTATSNRELAIRAAKMANQKAIFDLSKFEEIPIGGDGAPVAGLTKGLGRLHQLFGKGAAQYGFAQGFVPNYAKKRLGEGLYGTFYDLQKKVGGKRIGKKEFFIQDAHMGNEGEFNVQQEYFVAKILAGLNGVTHPVSKAPEIFGNLGRSMKRLAIGKEVIPGITGKDFIGKVSGRDGANPMDFNIKILTALNKLTKDFVYDDYFTKGVGLNDLHHNNYLLNARAQAALLRLVKKNDLDGIGYMSGKQIADYVAKRGGRVSVVDPGLAELVGKDTPARQISSGLLDQFRKDGHLPQFAGGFVPNYALKSMGAGKYGEFFDTGKTIGGVRVGVKKFFPVDAHLGNTGAENAEQEFMVSKLLEKLNGTVHPLYQAPRIFGSLRRAKEKLTIGKEIMPGLTGDDLVKKTAKEDRDAFLKGGGEQVDRASTVRQINKAIAGGFGAESYDYLGLLLNDFHSQNYILNDKAQKEILKMVGDFADPYDVVNENPKDLADRIAKAGGRLSLIDAGLAEVFGASKLPARKIVNKYFPYGGLASGYVPNYAKDPLEAAIEREKAAGLPESQIYVDHVKTPRYSGPVVANKRDEPNRSALLKRISEHPAPAFAGIVPNYADKKLTKKEKAELRKEIYEALKNVQTENARRAAFARFEDPTQKLEGADVGHVGDALLRQFFNDSGVGHHSNEILQQATPKLFKAGQAHVAQQLAQRQFRYDLQQAVVREQKPRGFFGDIIGSYGIERRINAATTPSNDADKLTRLNTVNQLRQERTNRLQNRGFQASFLLPALAGQVQSFAGVDPESRGGRIASGITSAVSGGVSVAALAPGPAGLAIGGLIATFGSLKAVTANLKDSFEVFSGKLRDNVNVVGERSSSVANVLQAQSNLQDIVQNGGSPAAITAARAQLNQLITDVPKKLQDKVRDAVDKNDTNALLRLTGETSLQKSRAESVAGALALVSKENEKNGLFRDSFANIVGPSRINSVAAQQGGFVDLLKKGEFGSAIARAQLNVADLVTTDKRPRSLREETVKAFSSIQTGFDDKDISKFTKVLNEKGSGAAFESILKDIGFNKDNRKGAFDQINAAAGGNAEEQTRIFDDIVRIMLTQSKAASQTAKNYEASVVKTKKINDLLDRFSQQVVANTQVAALARQNRRELAVSGVRGLVDANRQTLSKSFQNKLDYDIGRLELRNNTQKAIAGLNTGLIASLPSSIPASLGKSDEVRRGFVNRITSISQNPTASGAQDLLNFIDSNTEGQSRDQETKNLQSELTKYASSLQELAVNNEQQLRVLEQQKVLAEQSLRAEERASVFGGDFRRMKDYDFSTVRQGLSAGATLNARGSSPRYLVDQGNYFDNFFHPRYDSRRNNEITRDRQRRQAEGSLELLNQGLLRDPKNVDAVRAQVKDATKGQLLNNIDTLLRDRNLPASFRRDLLTQRADVDNIAEEQSRRLVPVSAESKNKLNTEIQKNLETARVSTRVEDNIQIVAAESRKTAENTLDIANTLRALAGATGATQTEITQSAAANKASGHLPNMIKEAVAIRRGVGGAISSDRPIVKNVNGLGNVVVNSGERIIQNFLGTGKGAVLTRDMQRSFSRGYVPNFADASVTPIFGKGVQKGLANAKSLIITDQITEEEDALRKMGLNFKARLAKVQTYLFNRTIKRHGGSGVRLEDLDKAIESSTPKGGRKSSAFYFSPQAEGGKAYISENFKKGNYFAPNVEINKYKEAISSRYMPETYRLDQVLKKNGMSLKDIIGAQFPDHILKPIKEGIQSQGIFRPGDEIKDFFMTHDGKVVPLKPNNYLVQQAYKLQSERSISKFLFSGGIGSYLRSSALGNALPERVLNALTTTGADYSHFFSNTEYRTHIATDEAGKARAIRYATANKNSPIRSMFANFYESAKIKAIEEAGRRAVEGLPKKFRVGGQLFGPDIAAIQPDFARAENARVGFEKFTSYQRGFFERLIRGNFKEKTGFFGALELNPTGPRGASGNASHGLEIDSIISQAKGKLPAHAIDARLKGLFSGTGDPSKLTEVAKKGLRLSPDRFRRAFLNTGIFSGLFGGNSTPAAPAPTTPSAKAAAAIKPNKALRATPRSTPAAAAAAAAAAASNPAAAQSGSWLSKLGPLWYQLAGYEKGKFGRAVGNALVSGSTFSNVYGQSPRSVGGLIGGAFKGGLINPVKDTFGIFGNSIKAATGLGEGGRIAGLKGLAGNAFGLGGKVLAGLAIAGGVNETINAASRGDVIGRNVAAGKTIATTGALALSAGAGVALGAGSAIGSQISKYGIGGIGGYILDKTGSQNEALRDFVDAAKDTKLSLNFVGDVLGGAAAAFGAAREAKAAGIKNSGFFDIINPFASKRAYSDALSKDEIERIDDESFERRVRFFAEKGRTTGLSEKMQKAVERYRKDRGLDSGNAAPVEASKPAAPASPTPATQPDLLAGFQRAEAAKMERQLAEAEQVMQRQKMKDAINAPNAIGLSRDGALFDTAGPQYFSPAVTGGEAPVADTHALPYKDDGIVRPRAMDNIIGVGRGNVPILDNTVANPNEVAGPHLPQVINRVVPAEAVKKPTTTAGALEKAYAEKLKKQEEEFRKNGYTERTVGYQSFAEGYVPNFSVLGSTGGLSRGAYGVSKRGRSLARRAFDSVGTARHSKRLENLILSGMIGGEVGGQNLQAAIEREREALQARGYYASGLIQVGYSPRIGGLGVYNKIDEPFGLEQGVDRVIRQGGNPMKSGQVPNFAESIEKLNGAIEKLGSVGGTGSSSTVDVLHNHNVQLSLGGEIRSANAQVASITNEEFAKMKESLEARIRELELATSKTNKGFFLRPESV